MRCEILSTNRQRNYNLDLIRIMACFAVVGLHVSGKDISVINTVWYYLCGFAVPAFFMASGYILMQRENIGFGYVVKKYYQILKVVFLWGSLAVLAVLIHGLFYGDNWQFIVWNAIEKMMGGLIQKGSFFHFWFLGALLIVYTILPVLVKLSKRKQFIVWLLGFAVGEILQVLSIYKGFPIQREIIQTFRIWTWIQYFLLGGFMHVVNYHIHKFSIVTNVVLFIGWTVGLMFYQLHMGTCVINTEIWMVQYAEFFYDSVFEIIWMILLFSLVLRLRMSIINSKIIGVISPLIMGVYIVHILVLRFFTHFIKAYDFISAVFLYIMVLGMSFFVVKIMWRFDFLRSFVKL